MREALGLAPKHSTQPQGNRLDKHEFSELVKRGFTAEDLRAGHAEATQVQGVRFSSRVIWSYWKRLHPVMIGKKTIEMDLITAETTQTEIKTKTSKPQTLLKVLRIFDLTWTFFLDIIWDLFWDIVWDLLKYNLGFLGYFVGYIKINLVIMYVIVRKTIDEHV